MDATNQSRQPGTSSPPLADDAVASVGTADFDLASKAGSAGDTGLLARRQILRYVVKKSLGSGSFGVVYLCHDPRLDRLVAVKVIDESKLSHSSPGEYLTEAKLLARLNHPSIVQVYDADHAEDGKPFVVSQYIPGGDLKMSLAKRTWNLLQSAAAVADLADALGHAHQHGIVHRDVKPANILLEESGRVMLADFGIALHEANHADPVTAGTVPYMSPEQTFGEGHRLDGRSDLFSLGVVFYEMLHGRRLFTGKNKWEIVTRIVAFDPDDLGELGNILPFELDRILRKMLAPRASDRYANAAALSRDLRNWLANEKEAAEASSCGVIGQTDGPVATPSPAVLAPTKRSLQPRGLRPFQAADAEIYLDLLPGIRDAEGLPEAVRFWLDRLDPSRAATDSEPIAVGVLYGPSGGGKSSLAAAGILPRLSRDVRVVAIECSPDDTAARITRALARMQEGTDPNPSHHSSGGRSLPDGMAEIRRRTTDAHRRVLLVLDQFEQWLRTWNGAPDDPLVLALRQCDGAKLQALVVVRDDFWSSTHRLLHLLEQPFADGKTASNVGGFSPRHARRVLDRLGRAYGAIANLAAGDAGFGPAAGDTSQTPNSTDPSDGSTAPAEAQKFIAAAVEQMTADGAVLPVRLTLFVEAVKELPWTLRTLRTIGGVEGAARHFLDATFGSNAPVGQRRLRKAASRALERLLPTDSGIEIKGTPQSAEQLLEAAGLSPKSDDAVELFDLLETRLKLITAVETDAATKGDSVPNTLSIAGFQLAHDHLIRPLRAWIDHDRIQTIGGRLRLRIDVLRRAWETQPEVRHLPAWWQWPALSIAYWTASSDFRNKRRADFMAAATRHFAWQFVAVAVACCALGWAFIHYERNQRANSLVLGLTTAEDRGTPQWINSLRLYRPEATSKLREIASVDVASLPHDHAKSRASRRARLALVALDLQPIGELPREWLVAGPSELESTRAVLASARDSAPPLWELANQVSSSDAKLRCAALLAGLTPVDERWAKLAPEVAATVCRLSTLDAPAWIRLLAPAGPAFEAPLRTQFQDRRADRVGEVAAQFLAECLSERPRDLCDLVGAAHYRQIRFLADKLTAHRTVASEYLASYAATKPKSNKRSDVVEAGRIAGNASLALVALGDIRGFRAVAANRIDPNARTKLVRGYAAGDFSFDAMLAELKDPAATDDSRFTALLAISGIAELGLKPSQQAALVEPLLEIYRDRPNGARRRPGSDSGVHALAGRLLGRIGAAKRLDAIHAEHVAQGVRADRDWYLVGEGHLMAIFLPQPQTHIIGPPPVDPDNKPILTVDYPFAVSTREVTAAHLIRLIPKSIVNRRMPTEIDEPARNVDMQYVFGYPEQLNALDKAADADRIMPNWQEMLPQAGKPYLGFITREVNLKETFGYRLPTDEEWDVACRAGSRRFWSFGDDGADLDAFENHKRSAAFETMPVASLLPNRAGMFDMQGNVWEYTMSMPWRRHSNKPDASFMIRFRGGSYLSFANATGAGRGFEMEMPCQEGMITRATGFRIARTMPANLKSE